MKLFFSYVLTVYLFWALHLVLEQVLSDPILAFQNFYCIFQSLSNTLFNNLSHSSLKIQIKNSIFQRHKYKLIVYYALRETTMPPSQCVCALFFNKCPNNAHFPACKAGSILFFPVFNSCLKIATSSPLYKLENVRFLDMCRRKQLQIKGRVCTLILLHGIFKKSVN